MSSQFLKWVIELPLLAEILVKATLFLAGAWVAHLVLRRGNPGWRVLLWRGVAVGLVTIPILRAALPELSVPVAPSPAPSTHAVSSIPVRWEPSPRNLSRAENAAPLRPDPAGPAPAATSIGPERPSLSLLSWARKHAIWFIFAGWSVVASILAARFSIGWRRICRIVKSAAPAPSALGSACHEIAHALGIAPCVQVRLSDEIPSPFLTGLRRPLLILPCRMAESPCSVELRAILAHELSHLRSNDLLWGYLLHWLSIVLWFHPLVWRIRPAHASACEGVSDGIAADFVGDVGGYSRTLARVALALASRARAAVGIPMARVSDITRRLRALKRRVFPAPLARSTVLISLLGGLLATGLLGCLRLDYTESGEPGALEVVVIDDNDPDYENLPFDDTLYLVGANGKVIKTIGGFNTCQTLGGRRCLALANDGSFVVCENAAHKMSKYDSDGNLAFSLDQDLDAVDVSGNGDLYCLLSSGTIHGDGVLIINPLSGETKKKAEYGGIDLVVDDRNDSVWIVGANIKRLNTKLEEVFTIDPVAWCAVSVDYASDGSAWVAERGVFLYGGSKDRLLNVSLEGKIVRTVDLGYCPFCVAVDRHNDNVWVAGTRGVYKYDKKGRESRVSREGAFGVRVNPRDHSVWVAGRNLRKYSAEGKLLSTVRLFPESQKFIAVRKWGVEEFAGIEAKAEGAEVPVPSPSEQERKLTARRVGEERGRIRGVVVNAETGEPISGAYVAVDHSGDAGGSNLGRFRNEGIYVTAESDDKGRFVLDGVAFHDNHPFMATHPGFVRHQETIALRTDEPEIDVKVRLRPAATIAAKVVDAEGKLLQGDALLRLEAGDGRPFFPMREDWPDLPYRTESTKTGTFSFGELDTGLFSIEVARFAPSEVIYHNKVSDIAVKAGETTEVLLKPADYRSTVKIKVEKDPYASLGEAKGAAALLFTRKPALLAWAGRNFYHPEDERLGRVWKSALIMGVLIPVEDAETLRRLQAEGRTGSVSKEGFLAYVSPEMMCTFRNFPPGEYAVFTYAMGTYKDWKSPAVYLRGARAVFSPEKETLAEIPWTEPIGPSPTNARTLYTVVNLEQKDYTAREVCELLIKETAAKPGEIAADLSIELEKVALPAGKLQIWDILESIYLQRGWRLFPDYKTETLVLRADGPMTR